MREYIELGKPRIAWLLIYTAIATYIFAEYSLTLDKILVFLIGGIFAVFGSNAINSVIDKDLDRMMRRTRNRPIPRGAIPPDRALLIGIIWLIIGFLIFTFYFGILAGLSALIGGLYYVIAYTIYLKRRTIWNTVIGGFAGSMPTITGWLAARNYLGIEPIILALIVFLWTPGHFWSLAYKVKEEYEIVDLPMLPVVKGDKYTRNMIILFYMLTAFSILLSIFFVESLAYVISAIVSVVLLIYAIYIIYARFDKDTAWRSFKISSPTLALLYTGLLISGLI